MSRVVWRPTYHNSPWSEWTNPSIPLGVALLRQESRHALDLFQSQIPISNNIPYHLEQNKVISKPLNLFNCHQAITNLSASKLALLVGASFVSWLGA